MITLDQFVIQPQLWPQLRLRLLTAEPSADWTGAEYVAASSSVPPSEAVGLVAGRDDAFPGYSWLACAGEWTIPEGAGALYAWGAVLLVGADLLAVAVTPAPLLLSSGGPPGLRTARLPITLESFDGDVA